MELTDEQHFHEYVAGRHAALTRTAYLLTGNHHDAEDLVQRALMKCVPRWSKIRANPEPYVRRVLYNENVSRWRRHPKGERLVDMTPEVATREADVATRETVRAALARLTPKQRTVLVLRFFEDLTEAQTAAALGIGLGTVKSQTRHALERLRVLAPDLEVALLS
ncbi:MAG TPA: SigE family RNA polymerase sigma factor [Nocardioidaceae bacterium]|nr:SigE family RNA polymerase sigma factor [Nocardioidaceae bacterium]